MSSKQGRVDRAVDRFMDLDGPTYGDERERAVFMEGTTLGMTLGIFANLAVAVIAAVLGGLAVPAVLLVLMVVPAAATIVYARRRGVNVGELSEYASLRRSLTILALVFGSMSLVMGAMAYTVFTGHGLLQLPSLELIGPDAEGVGASFVRGGVIGGLGGALLGAFVIVLAPRLGRKRSNAADDDLDED